MKNVFLFALFLFILIKTSFGQAGNINISQNDSIKLVKAWSKFKKYLYLKDLDALKRLSCRRVFGHCGFEPIDTNCNPYGSSQELLTLFFKEIFPQDREIIVGNNYKIVAYSSIKDKAMKIKYPTQYQIWFTNKSTPGYQFAFVFQKVREKFKFSGLDSIP